MSLVREIDNFVFEAKFGYQPMSEKIQIWTGKNCFAQSRLALLLMLASNFFDNVSAVESGDRDVFTASLFVSINFVASLVFLRIIKTRESMMSSKRGTMNSARIDSVWRLLRVFYFFLTIMAMPLLVVSPGSVPLFLAQLSCTSVLFLFACTPLPPSESKIKEWFTARLASATPA